ncbi:MAG: hypothetical protein GY769_09685 [bacterium]|nr:hypothetical protein [bacterium]
MKKSSKYAWAGQIALAIVATAFIGAGCPPDIPPGTDCWVTQPGTAQTVQIPHNFFGPASDPVNTVIPLEGLPLSGAEVLNCGCTDDVEIEWVDRHGNPTDPNSGHAVEQRVNPTDPFDTCIWRKVTANWDGENVGVDVEIELRQLSLKSVEPLEVTWHETTDPVPSMTKLFDVFVTESATQNGGSMTFTPDDLTCNKAEGGITLGDLPVKWDVRFVEVGGGIERTITDQPLILAGTLGDFLKNR